MASAAAVVTAAGIASGVIVGDSFERRDGSPAAMLNIFVLPLYLRDLVFLGEIDREFDLSGVDNGGLMAIVLYAAIVVAGIAVLLRRYRWVER